MTPRPTAPKRSSPPRTVSIGAATVDVFVQPGTALAHTPDGAQFLLPLGAKIRIDHVVETCGGGASNTAVGLSRLGCDAGFGGIIGSDQWGERILANLRRERVRVEGATIVEGETSNFSIILNADRGERVILYASGVSAHLHDVTFDRESAAGHDWLYFNHIHEDSCVIQDDIAAMLRAHPAMSMSWNPGGRQLKRGIDDKDNEALLRQTDLLLLNKEEALAFTRKQTTERAMQALLKAGVTVICVSDGANGCEASDGRNVYHCPAVADATVADATGAGDAFGTGVTWALLQGLDLPTMLRAGTINATSVLATIGAQAGLLTDIEMHTRLRTTHLDVTMRSL